MPALYWESSSRGSRGAFWPIPIQSSHKGCTQNDSVDFETAYKLKAEF